MSRYSEDSVTTTLTDFSGETDNSRCISETGRCAGQRRGRAWLIVTQLEVTLEESETEIT